MTQAATLLLRLPAAPWSNIVARCLAASGAAPLVVLVERVPVALNDAFERLRAEGISVVPVSDGNEAQAVSSGQPAILLGDGIAPDMGDLERLVAESDNAIPTVPDDGTCRIRADRWAAPLGRLTRGSIRHPWGHGRDAWRLGPAIDPARARDPVRSALRIVDRRGLGRSWPPVGGPVPTMSGACWSLPAPRVKMSSADTSFPSWRSWRPKS